MPQLRPSLAASSLLVALYTLSDFGAVSLLGYETFTRAIYTQFRGRLDVAPADVDHVADGVQRQERQPDRHHQVEGGLGGRRSGRGAKATQTQ